MTAYWMAGMQQTTGRGSLQDVRWGPSAGIKEPRALLLSYLQICIIIIIHQVMETSGD